MFSPYLNLLVIISTIFTFSSNLAISQTFDFPVANLSTTWINSVSSPANHSMEYWDNTTVRVILLRDAQISHNGPKFACGFYCNGDCETYIFGIFYVETYVDGGISPARPPAVVWSANRNNPVRINATLQLTAEGDLVLRDADGTLAWSANTSGMSVAGLNLTEMGNLVLFDNKHEVVWQSFDHPTDALLPGQRLTPGQNLTASVSSTNWSEGGLYSLSMTDKSLIAYIHSDPDPPQAYFTPYGTGANFSYFVFGNGSFQIYANFNGPDDLYESTDIPQPTSAQYMRLDPDGHLRLYDWGSHLDQVYDVMAESLIGLCGYPMSCGKYGICSNGQCSCPSSRYFQELHERQPHLGCSEISPVTCDMNSSTNYNHTFLDLEDVTYFYFTPDINGTDVNGCKEACLRNCSCKAAIFLPDYLSNRGSCYLPSQLFSLIRRDTDNNYPYNASVYVKVQSITNAANNTTVANVGTKNKYLGPIVGSTIGTVLVVASICLIVFLLRRRKNINEAATTAEAEDDCLDHYVSGMPTRFCYEDLVLATENFSRKLGKGGFGTVFEGSLKDGTKIAVKCLDGIGHIKKSFLAEVETIGSINHVNLVRLIGFCSRKSQKLLVYEYMCNGALDRWIYNGADKEKSLLDWSCRRKIILDIAKGLAYLHEECRHKIIHLDIKPQNILLDENFNAKVADFGLSKLIDRNQREVVTTMRGTPGYLAPEWLSAVITEKVDVYSFGVVILEILCGRKNFDQSQPEEQRHLLSLFKNKAEEGKWLDIVDKAGYMQSIEGLEFVELMMQLAAWCLQYDYSNRPSMSMVVKVLEGGESVPRDRLNYNFLIPHILSSGLPEVGSEIEEASSLLPSVLSAPR